MTDTTDQQAVTVAQEDREAAAGYLDSQGGYVIDAAVIRTGQADFKDIVHAFARHRLASVPSASADYVLVPREPTEAMLEALHRDVRIKADPALKTADIMNEREVWSAMLAASPQPVPATNQAGEAELGVYDALKLAHDTLHETTAVLHADDCARVAAVMTQCREALALADRLRTYRPTDEWGDGVHHAICTEAADTIAALATQPATSQEGECNCGCAGDPFICTEADGTDRAASQEGDEADRANGIGQDELVAGLKRVLQHPAGDHDGWTDAGMEDAFFRWPVIVNALNEALAATPTPPTGYEPWVPRIGDPVRIAPGDEYASEWARTDFWVAGLSVDDRGRGIDVTVSEQWPIPTRHSRDYMGQTDGFLIARTDGKPDSLEPRALARAQGQAS